ncbi:MAG: transposase IS4 family protein [Chloroflexi bacterium OLB13]|nr:MAG: transposase IS4 family protein [Chloroflexi bacterium OLB13]
MRRTLEWLSPNKATRRANRMDETYIVTAYVVLDDVLKVMNYRDDVRATVSAAEVLTVAVVAARYFQNHHERALCVLQRIGALPRLSVSRFNRKLHRLSSHMGHLLSVLMEVLQAGEVFIIDSMPVPVCKRVRAGRCRKLQGKRYFGRCAAKDETFFGWRLHLVCSSDGLPVAFDILPAAWHDLTGVQWLTAELAAGSTVVGDKGYNSDLDETLCDYYGAILLLPKRRKNMVPDVPEHQALLRRFRPVIETVHSQLEKMGVQRLHARTNLGLFLKLYASLLALLFNPFV